MGGAVRWFTNLLIPVVVMCMVVLFHFALPCFLMGFAMLTCSGERPVLTHFFMSFNFFLVAFPVFFPGFIAMEFRSFGIGMMTVVG